MYDRLLKIDALSRPDHTFLTPDDECYYMGEYTARGGFGASATNDLIQNFKKPMDRKGRAEWGYKNAAKATIAYDLRRILGRQGIETATFVPIPPSKARGDPAYDDRLLQVLKLMSEGYAADVRELVIQRESMAASHGTDTRASINELTSNYMIDESLAQPIRNGNIVIFDDVLTTGRHFKAMQSVLTERFPHARALGLFVARRVPGADDLSKLFSAIAPNPPRPGN